MEILISILIQDIHGNLYTEDEWDSSSTPNGVAVITENCSFVIALENVSQTDWIVWGGKGKLISDIVTTTEQSVAMLDFNGNTNTQKIVSQLKNYTDANSFSGSPAASACQQFIFPNEQTGYLGSAGEWQVVLDNIDKIKSALSKCGGDKFNYTHWTSTQYDDGYAWCVYGEHATGLIDNGKLTQYEKSYSRSPSYGHPKVRAFTTLE